MVDRSRHLPRQLEKHRPYVLARHPAAERHRRAAHRPHARAHRDRCHHPLASHARRQHAVAARAPTTPASPPRWWSSAKLAEEGINRRDLGREEFEKRVWEWKAQSGDTIKRQMIRLGASCDWSPRALHARPGPLARRPRSLRPPLRKRPHLPRRVHGELVPALPDRHLRSRSRSTKKRRATSGTSAIR